MYDTIMLFQWNSFDLISIGNIFRRSEFSVSINDIMYILDDIKMKQIYHAKN